jgi:hypothetical protein
MIEQQRSLEKLALAFDQTCTVNYRFTRVLLYYVPNLFEVLRTNQVQKPP